MLRYRAQYSMDPPGHTEQTVTHLPTQRWRQGLLGNRQAMKKPRHPLLTPRRQQLLGAYTASVQHGGAQRTSEEGTLSSDFSSSRVCIKDDTAFSFDDVQSLIVLGKQAGVSKVYAYSNDYQPKLFKNC